MIILLTGVYNMSAAIATQNITCRWDFILINGTCFPHCGQWALENGVVMSLETSVTWIATLITLTSSVVSIVVSIVRYKFM